jgi:NDP-sugar pyrophosphorylase family protein
MHALSHLLRGEKFCLTTVDTLFREDEFANYIKKLEEYEGDGIMAVTDYIDDEKPLYIATDEKMEITAFCDKPTPETHYISGGIYGLSPKALEILDRCINDGIHRMRNFQRRLVESGMKLKAFPLGKIIDIDHAEDIIKAEEFIAER